MTHNGTCNNVKGLKHRVYWNFKEPEIDENIVRFNGVCLVCETEFQTTYDHIGNTIISKTSREPKNFNFEIDEPQFTRTTESKKKVQEEGNDGHYLSEKIT